MKRQLLLLTLLLSTLSSALAADGTLLIANRNGGSVSMIDLQSNTEIARLPIGPVVPHEMAASPDGRWAVTGEYGSGNNPGRHLVVIDVAAARIDSRIDLGPNSRPHSIAFFSDSRRVVVTMENSDQLALVDIVDKEIIRTFPSGGSESHMVRLSPDNSRAYVTSRGSGTLSVIWLNEDRPRTVIVTGRRAEGIAVSPDGQQIWIANQGDSTISIVDADTLEVFAGLEGITTNRIEFLSDGTAVIPGGISADGSVRYVTFYDGKTREVIRTLELPGSTAAGTGIRLLASNGLLFLADSALNKISGLDPETANPPEQIISNPDNVDGMAWSPLRLEILNN
jgi:DNA-binding beta-propeller fold protein YncE